MPKENRDESQRAGYQEDVGTSIGFILLFAVENCAWVFSQDRSTKLAMKRVLFVDDDVDLLAATKTFLRKQGFEVATTTSCKEGLEILEAFHPELVLLDINVGDEDGRLMCRRIKEQAEYERIPVILMSANHEELATYRDYGADNFLKKPFELSAVTNALKGYLR